jgi:hypothetical protein
MLSPIDPKTGKAVPKKDRKKFIEDENGYFGKALDLTKPEQAPRPKHSGLRPVKKVRGGR